MELAQSLRLKMHQKLVMTPQLQQVIKLLQLPTIELIEMVQQELDTNPTLEEGPQESPAELPKEAAEDKADAALSEESMDNWLALAAEEGPREVRDHDREDEQDQMQENKLVHAHTLQDHLIEQLKLLEEPAEDIRLAEVLIGNLDDNGYLTTPLEELKATAGAACDKLESALLLVQSLDPPGVGARDLKECLLLQLREFPENTTLARQIVTEHLTELETKNGAAPATLAKLMNETEEAVRAAMKQIRACDPKPGGRFAEAPPAVFPDARVEKVGREYVVTLNDNGLPPLRLSKAYRELLAKRGTLGEDERRFLQERFRSALMLMKGIEQRRVTLYKTLEHIVKKQSAFIEQGLSALRPLTLREVADAIGVHESTISRVVANKYVSTPGGLRALKDFFSNRMPNESSGGTSGAAVRTRVRDLIETESGNAPLSDEQLADRLKREGITIARRTVTKYREALKFPPAWQRKQDAATNEAAR